MSLSRQCLVLGAIALETIRQTTKGYAAANRVELDIIIKGFSQDRISER
jgi:hypothetical protein